MADIGTAKPFVRASVPAPPVTAVLEPATVPITIDEAIKQSSHWIFAFTLLIGFLFMLRPFYVAYAQYRADHAAPETAVPLGWTTLRRRSRYVQKQGGFVEQLR